MPFCTGGGTWSGFFDSGSNNMGGNVGRKNKIKIPRCMRWGSRELRATSFEIESCGADTSFPREVSVVRKN